MVVLVVALVVALVVVLVVVLVLEQEEVDGGVCTKSALVWLWSAIRPKTQNCADGVRHERRRVAPDAASACRGGLSRLERWLGGSCSLGDRRLMRVRSHLYRKVADWTRDEPAGHEMSRLVAHGLTDDHR